MRLELDREVTRHGLGGSVRFLGARFDVPALLPCLDVFVLSSVHEGLPLALLEAMACAKPVVVTDVGGVAALVDGGRTGVVVAPGDVDGLAKAVVGLLRDPVLAAQLGRAARMLAEQRYDLRATIDAYLDLCRGPRPGAPGMTEYSTPTSQGSR